MDALDSLTGIEFENLCKELLGSMGFIVETTSTTGDGGIDLIARYNAPILSGKYIIQCKRYAGSVGVPVVRDLYGVVTAERANKGVLITTGRVTNASVEFARDKNLELIDGIKLRRLISKTDIHIDGEDHPSSFVDYPSFDTERYQYYVESMAEGPHDLSTLREFALGFLMPYLLKKDVDSESLKLIHAGLAEEYTRRVDQYLSIEYGKRKTWSQLGGQRAERRLKGFAWLYSFELSEYVRSQSCYFRFNHGVLNWAGNKELECSNSLLIRKLSREKLCQLADLYSLFSYFDMEECCSRVIREMGASEEHARADLARALFGIYRGRVLLSHPDVADWQRDADRFHCNNDPVSAYEAGSLDLTPYFNSFVSEHREKVKKEIAKAERIIRYLPQNN